MSKYQAALKLLTAIEGELKQLSLWQSDYPSAQALCSQQPFCCDTLRFEQWLQFILIPRITVLIEGHHPLPSDISIMPMAEEAFKMLGVKVNVLIKYIDEFDLLLSDK